MLAFAAMGAFMPPGRKGMYDEDLTPHEIDEIKKSREVWLKQRELERNKKRGLKEFEIDGIKILALNYKNAVRKVDRLKKEWIS